MNVVVIQVALHVKFGIMSIVNSQYPMILNVRTGQQYTKSNNASISC